MIESFIQEISVVENGVSRRIFDQLAVAGSGPIKLNGGPGNEYYEYEEPVFGFRRELQDNTCEGYIFEGDTPCCNQSLFGDVNGNS